MNLLCPSCQKMLTVPDQFAGQLMKCPLCSSNFTVPGLPGAPSGAAAAPAGSAATVGGDLYGLQHEPVPPPPAPPLPTGGGTADLHAPSFPSSPPLGPPPTTPAPGPAPSIAPSPPPTGYQTTRTMFLSPRVLPWVAPVCLVLIFFLQFFSWAGIYPGGVPWVTGNAWQVAFNFYSHDHDLDGMMRDFLDKPKEGEKVKDYSPGWSALLVLYLFLFFPALAVTILSVALPWIPLKLPPAVEGVLPWRWAIVAAVNLVLFLFLGLQLLVGFSVESKFTDDVNKQVDNLKAQKTDEIKQADAQRGTWLSYLSTTFWLKLVVLLHLVAILCSLLAFWINQRGSQRPPPKLEVAW